MKSTHSTCLTISCGRLVRGHSIHQRCQASLVWSGPSTGKMPIMPPQNIAALSPASAALLEVKEPTYPTPGEGQSVTEGYASDASAPEPCDPLAAR